jgi:uncharacterized damage-inducible protein DinB
VQVILQKQLENLEAQRVALLHLLNGISKEQFHKAPAGKWSLAQVLSHLVTSEKLSVGYLNKKIQAIDQTSNTGLVSELKMLALIISQRLPLKFEAPKVVVENTSAYQTLPEIEEAWQKTREDLKVLLVKFNDRQLKKKIYKHPIAGRLNIMQTLRFFQEHIIHHTPQIKNLLKQN